MQCSKGVECRHIQHKKLAKGLVLLMHRQHHNIKILIKFKIQFLKWWSVNINICVGKKLGPTYA